MHILHILIYLLLLYLHIEKTICNLKEYKMIKQIYNVIKTTYKAVNDNSFENIDPNLIRYFRTEFGSEWQEALHKYIEKNKQNNENKAA
tara:strand:+ start:363 stop:629 length:267 start_codon:yes stop_codon:yes gene_type:complete